MSKKKIILSVDGGGVFGAAPAKLLSLIPSERLVFDAYAGTSIGSAIAASLSVGVPPGKILRVFEERMNEVFPQSIWSKLNIVGARYPDKGLNRVIQDLVGVNTRFGDARAQLVIVAANLVTEDTTVYDSTDPSQADLPMWEVVRQSVAAPTYFPPWKQHVDGGIFANNPSQVGITGVLQGGTDDDDIWVVSLGCGEDLLKQRKNETTWWPTVLWAPKLLRMMLNGGANRMHHRFARSSVGPDRIIRIQYNRDPEWGFDNPKNVELCLNSWRDGIAEGGRRVTEFIDRYRENS